MKHKVSRSELKIAIPISLVVLVLLVLFGSSNSPYEAVPGTIVSFFILVYLSLATGAYTVSRLLLNTSKINALQTAIVLSAIPTMALGLSSLQQFGLTDIVILTLLVLLVLFYLRKRKLG